MKKILASAVLAALLSVCAQAQDAKPVWKLGDNKIDNASIELVDGVLKLDGTNSFEIPSSFLGSQNDYTIEFEVKRAADVAPEGSISLISNSDEKAKTGIAFKYFPPKYNAIWLMTNGARTVEYGNFLGDKFVKVSIVVKDKKLTLFKDGLILAATDVVNPSQLPLTVGEILKKPVAPYELRGLKIYAQAVFPTGFDQSAERMRNYSGDQYMMQRVDIKDPSLPRILVVGDSISMGYRSFITKHFKDKANVDYWVGGTWFGDKAARGPEADAKRGWRGVMAQGPYDVVSWNAMTLHMWNGYAGRVDEATFPATMTEMLEFLLTSYPNTKFIWIRCTPWRTTPETGRPGIDASHNDRIVRLNAAVDEIMVKHGVPEVDLYSLCLTRFDTLPDGAKDAVHWDAAVSSEMADLIIAEIEKALAEKKAQAGK